MISTLPLSDRDKLEGLQALRAVAALSVVVFHAGRYVAGRLPAPAWTWGEFGIDVFFVLSGFVMAWATRPGMSAWQFLARRVARIAPMYWLATLAMAIALALQPTLFHAAVLDPGHIAKSLAFIPHFNPGTPSEVWPLFVPGWTLNYEMYFYLIFALSLPLVASLGRRALAILAILLVGIGAASALGDARTQAWAAFLANPIVLEFAFGMGVALMIRRGWRLDGRLAAMVAGLAFGTLIAIADTHTRIWSAGLSAVAMVFAGACFPAFRTTSGRWLARLGDASYTLYLIQPFAIGALWLVWRGSPLDAGTAGACGFIGVCVIASALAALPIHRWIEQPMTRWLSSVLTRPRRVRESA